MAPFRRPEALFMAPFRCRRRGRSTHADAAGAPAENALVCRCLFVCVCVCVRANSRNTAICPGPVRLRGPWVQPRQPVPPRATQGLRRTPGAKLREKISGRVEPLKVVASDVLKDYFALGLKRKNYFVNNVKASIQVYFNVEVNCFNIRFMLHEMNANCSSFI